MNQPLLTGFESMFTFYWTIHKNLRFVVSVKTLVLYQMVDLVYKSRITVHISRLYQDLRFEI